MMAIKPVIDYGQVLATPEGQAIGFVDTKEQFAAVIQALKAAGYADSNIIALQGDDGIAMLERLQNTFHFGDGEDAIMEFSIKELQAGHYALCIEANDRAAALRAASLAEPLGAHSFSYFGIWMNERLTR
jgi:hypothetical protein